MIGGLSKAQWDYSENNATLCGSFINQAMAMALSCSEVNACMGKICAAPTARFLRILPAVMASVAERRHLSQKEILKGLLTASGLGAIVVKNATVAGGRGGCQAECGVAAAMAAAGAVESAKALLRWRSMPFPGIKQLYGTCVRPHRRSCTNTLRAAECIPDNQRSDQRGYGHVGMEFIIPPDQVVEAMYKVGKLTAAGIERDCSRRYCSHAKSKRN